jgi:DNA processing protein
VAQLDEKECIPWLALARVKGLGCTGFKKLAENLEDPGQVFSASERELSRIPELNRQAIEGILAFSEWEEVRREWSRACAAGVKLLAYRDRNYPPRLRVIPDPPPVLYVKGDFEERDERAVAVVGSRSASDYGLRMTRNLCRGLASLGITVVSGMARGIDGEAHEAALEMKGRTAAVLGSGVDVAYPWEHKALHERIGRAGAVLSELPMGTPPFSYNFPSRNRLISGLSLGVVVVEATERSGSLITARLALEQGREVFAVPGEAGASRSRGTHRLIRQGAKLVEKVEDIVEEIALQVLSIPSVVDADRADSLTFIDNPDKKKIFDLVQPEPLQIDELIQRSGLSSARVSEILLQLELEGYLKQLPGKKFWIN